MTITRREVYQLALAHAADMDRRQASMHLPPIAEDPTLSMGDRAREALIRIVNIEHTATRGGRVTTADVFATMAHLAGMCAAIHEAELMDVSTGEAA
jgi:hypothetical protein